MSTIDYDEMLRQYAALDVVHPHIADVGPDTRNPDKLRIGKPAPGSGSNEFIFQHVDSQGRILHTISYRILSLWDFVVAYDQVLRKVADWRRTCIEMAGRYL
jgi:hypothetical protein